MVLVKTIEPLPFGTSYSISSMTISTPVTALAAPPATLPTGTIIADVIIYNSIQESKYRVEEIDRRRHQKEKEDREREQSAQMNRYWRPTNGVEGSYLPNYNSYPTPQRTFTPATPPPRSRTYSILPDAPPSSPIQGSDIIRFINWHISTRNHNNKLK